MKRLEYLSFEKRLRDRGCSGCRRKGSVETPDIVHTLERRPLTRHSLFPVVPCDRTRGNMAKLKDWRFHLSSGKCFFTGKVIELWQRLPTVVMESPWEMWPWAASSRSPYWNREVEPGDFLRSLPTTAPPWFCILFRKSSKSNHMRSFSWGKKKNRSKS